MPARESGGPVGCLEEERMQRKRRGHLCIHARMGKEELDLAETLEKSETRDEV